MGQCAAVFAALFLVAPGAATAARPYEPNETAATATGPLRAATTYAAFIERLPDPWAATPGDQDWYAFYTARAVTIRVAYRNLQQKEDCFGPEARLLDSAGVLLGVAQPPAGESARISYRAPAAGRYLLHVRPYQIEPCPRNDQPYRFSITPAGALRALPGTKFVKPVRVRLNPRLKVTSAQLRGGWLQVRGTRARDTSARRIRVTAWSTGLGKKASFRLGGRAKGERKWSARRRIPDRLRQARTLRYRAAYLGGSGFGKRTLRPRVVRVRR